MSNSIKASSSDYHNNISLLEVYDVENKTRTVLKEYDYLIEAPNWTPDGKALIYNSKGKLVRFNLDTHEDTEINTDFADNCNNDHVLSPDGSQVAISNMTNDGGFTSKIYTLPIGGGVPALITPNSPSFLHGWSPDGKTLAYCAFRGEDANIYTIPVTGGEETRLTYNEKGLDDGPEYSPDGRHIWFNSVKSGLMQVWRMNADGSGQTQITFDEANSWFPHVSPDGSKIVYIVYKKGDLEPNQHLPNLNVELKMMNYDGSGSHTICSLFGGQGTINVNSWSPCSKKFAFVSYKLRD